MAKRCPKCSADSFNIFSERGSGKVQCSQCRGTSVIKTTRGEKKIALNVTVQEKWIVHDVVAVGNYLSQVKWAKCRGNVLEIGMKSNTTFCPP